ncbi:MAG: hypothetical protein IJV00_00930 [Clostridia bacterium]|nr:hypothetical protein [Clostridia bacterium]
MSELIGCAENCVYQNEGQCTLENVPEFCLRLNSKKACIYYVRRDKKMDEQTDPPKTKKTKTSGFESYF